MSFKVIPPIEITNSTFSSSSIAEPDIGEVAWDSGTTYDVGERVYKADTHIMYESLIASNLDNDPSLETQTDLDNPPTIWLEIGRTNRWEMFNLLRSNKSITTSPLTVSLTPSQRINSIGFFGLDATELTVKMNVSGEVVYAMTEPLSTREIFDFYDYFYEPFTSKPSAVFFDLPPITDGILGITITSTSGIVEVGSIAAGNFVDIGQVLYGAESDVLNFSRIDRAFDGSALLKQRRSIPKVIANVVADKNKTNKIRSLRTELNATPAVWAGLDQAGDDYFEAVLILGIYKKFTIKLEHPTATESEIEIEEI